MPYRLATPLEGEITEREPEPLLRLSSSFLGWVKGLEPSTPGTTIRCSNQLSYTHHIHDCHQQRGIGTPEGTRTPDPLLRRQLLYPAELQARMERGKTARWCRISPARSSSIVQLHL